MLDEIQILVIQEVLEVQNNKIGDESMESIIRLMGSSNLKSLDLTNNQFTCEGMAQLAKYFKDSGDKVKLAKLNLSLNKVRDDGFKSLCQVLQHTTISRPFPHEVTNTFRV